jgi:hypothetical protein
MADLRYIRPNHLCRRANRVRALVVVPGIPTALCLGLIHPLLMLPTGIALLAIWNRQRRLLKGAQGEDLALGVPTAVPGPLSRLGDDYMVFNQLRVPWRNTTLELDFVVVGPNGVFDIECKHLVEEIVGRDVDQQWVQRKRGRGGVLITRGARNPVVQVRRSARALATYLRSIGINVSVHAVVVFTHPVAKLSVSSNSVPVLTLPQLADHIANLHGPFQQQGAVMRALKVLRDTEPSSVAIGTAQRKAVSMAGGPKHISYFMRDIVPERVEVFMKHDIRAAMRKQHGSAPATSQRSTTASPPAIPRTYRPRRQLRVITFARSGEKLRRRTVRTYRCEETIETEKSNESEIGRD